MAPPKADDNFARIRASEEKAFRKSSRRDRHAAFQSQAALRHKQRTWFDTQSRVLDDKIAAARKEVEEQALRRAYLLGKIEEWEAQKGRNEGSKPGITEEEDARREREWGYFFELVREESPE